MAAVAGDDDGVTFHIGRSERENLNMCNEKERESRVYNTYRWRRVSSGEALSSLYRKHNQQVANSAKVGLMYIGIY